MTPVIEASTQRLNIIIKRSDRLKNVIYKCNLNLPMRVQPSVDDSVELWEREVESVDFRLGRLNLFIEIGLVLVEALCSPDEQVFSSA